MLPSSPGTLQTHLKAKCVGSFRCFSAMTKQFILWYGKKTPRMASLVSRYPMRWDNTVCNTVSIYQSKQICRSQIFKDQLRNAECSNCQTFKGTVPQLKKQCCFIEYLLEQWALVQLNRSCCSSSGHAGQRKKHKKRHRCPQISAKIQRRMWQQLKLRLFKEKELISPTYRTCILARPQKAPSVSLLMLLRWSFRTSRLSSPWNVSPSIRRMRFRFSSLKSPRPNKFIKTPGLSHKVISAAHNGDSNSSSSSVSGSQETAEEHRKLSIPELSRAGSWVQSPKQTHPGTDSHYRGKTEGRNSSSSLLSLHFF